MASRDASVFRRVCGFDAHEREVDVRQEFVPLVAGALGGGVDGGGEAEGSRRATQRATELGLEETLASGEGQAAAALAVVSKVASKRLEHLRDAHELRPAGGRPGVGVAAEDAALGASLEEDDASQAVAVHGGHAVDGVDAACAGAGGTRALGRVKARRRLGLVVASRAPGSHTARRDTSGAHLSRRRGPRYPPPGAPASPRLPRTRIHRTTWRARRVCARAGEARGRARLARETSENLSQSERRTGSPRDPSADSTFPTCSGNEVPAERTTRAQTRTHTLAPEQGTRPPSLLP